MFQDLFRKAIGYQEGGPNLRDALEILGNERIRKKHERVTGDYTIPRVKTQRGGTESYEQLNDWFRQAQIQRASDLDSIPTEQELNFSGYREPITPNPQVLGVNTNTSGYNPSPSPVEGLALDDNIINTILGNAGRWAGTPHGAPNLIYRKPDTVGENVQYVRDYLDSILRHAPDYDLPPKTLAAMLMYESGWGGERFDGNLGGYGFISTPEGGVHDMGFRFGAPTPQEQAINFMKHLSGTRYKGARNVDDFVSRGYNSVNPEYSKMVNSVLNMLLAQ